MAAPLPLLQLNPRGDQGSVDSHPTGGEQWVPLPGLAWFPASLFWFPARGWWPAGLCVTQSVTPTIPSLAMCTQPHLLLLRKSHCTARAPAHLNECSVSWWVLGCWAAPALWAPATTGLSDTLSPTPSLPSLTLRHCPGDGGEERMEKTAHSPKETSSFKSPFCAKQQGGSTNWRF